MYTDKLCELISLKMPAINICQREATHINFMIYSMLCVCLAVWVHVWKYIVLVGIQTIIFKDFYHLRCPRNRQNHIICFSGFCIPRVYFLQETPMPKAEGFPAGNTRVEYRNQKNILCGFVFITYPTIFYFTK